MILAIAFASNEKTMGLRHLLHQKQKYIKDFYLAWLSPPICAKPPASCGIDPLPKLDEPGQPLRTDCHDHHFFPAQIHIKT